MSVELDFYLTVARIPRGRVDAVATAIAKVLVREGLADLHGPVPIDEPPGLAWTSDPSQPMIISGSYRWVPKVDAAIAAAVRKASRGKAKPATTWIYRELRSRYRDTLRTMKQLLRKSVAVTTPTPGRARRFELVDGRSRKFWEIARDGAAIVVTFGRIGSRGQTKPRRLSSPAAASAELEKLVAEKRRKGYREVNASRARRASAAR